MNDNKVTPDLEKPDLKASIMRIIDMNDSLVLWSEVLNPEHCILPEHYHEMGDEIYDVFQKELLELKAENESIKSLMAHKDKLQDGANDEWRLIVKRIKEERDALKAELSEAKQFMNLCLEHRMLKPSLRQSIESFLSKSKTS